MVGEAGEGAEPGEGAEVGAVSGVVSKGDSCGVVAGACVSGAVAVSSPPQAVKRQTSKLIVMIDRGRNVMFRVISRERISQKGNLVKK